MDFLLNLWEDEGVDGSVCDEVCGGKDPKTNESSSLLRESSVDIDCDELLFRDTLSQGGFADFGLVSSSSNILSISAIFFFHPNETSDDSSVASYILFEVVAFSNDSLNRIADEFPDVVPRNPGGRVTLTSFFRPYVLLTLLRASPERVSLSTGKSMSIERGWRPITALDVTV